MSSTTIHFFGNSVYRTMRLKRGENPQGVFFEAVESILPRNILVSVTTLVISNDDYHSVSWPRFLVHLKELHLISSEGRGENCIVEALRPQGRDDSLPKSQGSQDDCLVWRFTERTKSTVDKIHGPIGRKSGAGCPILHV